MANQFPLGDKELCIGILGMTEGNAHPFSWSAMYNGYDKDVMYEWTHELYPSIPDYLGKQPPETFGIPGAHITHVCFTGYEDRAMAENCARASRIPNVCTDPLEMLGHVDAVICATDIGAEHVERCRPFIEAGLPMFIDKPLCDNEEDLKTIVKWHDEGAHFISSSSMRYEKSIEPYQKCHYELGEIRYILSPMAKKWETYGMHAVEAIFDLLGPGFTAVQNGGPYEKNWVHLYHKNGCYVDIPMEYGMTSRGVVVLGNRGSAQLSDGDSYYAFKKQMDNFVHFLRTGEEPTPFSNTVEMAKIIIAGIRSREEGGRMVELSEIHER